MSLPALRIVQLSKNAVIDFPLHGWAILSTPSHEAVMDVASMYCWHAATIESCDIKENNDD